MTEGHHCRSCGPLAFGLSMLLHGAVAALLLWLDVAPPADDVAGERDVAVTLAMFDDGGSSTLDADLDSPAGSAPTPAPSDASIEAATAAREPPEPPEPPSDKSPAEPVAQPIAQLADAAESAPQSPVSLPTNGDAQPQAAPAADARPKPAAKVAQQVAPKPEPRPAATSELKPIAEPKPAAKQRPKPEPKPAPKPEPQAESKPKSKPRPKPAVAQKPPQKAPAAKPSDLGAGAGGRGTAGDGRSGAGKSASSRSAGSGGTGAGSAAAAKRKAESAYLSELQRALSRRRYYPKTAQQRGLEGTASVQFTISASGSFSGIRVSGGSGSTELDKAAVTTVKRLGKFKPIPKSTGRSSWTVRVPIVYRLK